MRKLFFYIYKIVLFISLSFLIFTPFFISLYLEKIEYYPYKIEKENNYLKEINLNNKFELEKKELLNDVVFDKEKKVDINICILDVFNIEENPKEEKPLYAHGEYVMHMVDKRYDGKVTLLPVDHFSFLNTPIEEWNKCDIINYSMGINAKDIELYFDSQFINFIKNYKGIMIASAGNEGNTNESSQWAYIKEKHPDLNTENLIIVTQGDVLYDRNKSIKPVIKTSYGHMVDIAVFNYSEVVYGKKLYGSSFASPVVTSVLGNLLQSGLSQEEVLDKVKNLEKIQIGNYSYSNFDIQKMYE